MQFLRFFYEPFSTKSRTVCPNVPLGDISLIDDTAQLVSHLGFINAPSTERCVASKLCHFFMALSKESG